MSHIDFLLARLKAEGERPALIFRGAVMDGARLAELTEQRIGWAAAAGVRPATPVALLGDYSFESTALLLALIALQAIVIPLTPELSRSLGRQIDEVAPRILIDATGEAPSSTEGSARPANRHYSTLAERQSPGLVLFTSGSSGKPKAVIHDFARLLNKFETPRPGMVSINFLMFDHWGGLNTLLHCLSSGSLLVLPESRNPRDICRLIEQFSVELLPTTPSFLNLLLISGAVRDYDLSSLKIISYGAEPMPVTTLRQLREALPEVELRQTYGMIELGVMRAKSKSSDSLWVKIGGEDYDLRVVDGILQVKTDAAMLGYLNEPTPLTEDGYFITGDMVEQQGEYFRILGRASELINVGGQKVYPVEVEAVILEVPGVIDAVVHGEKNLLLGNIVVADVVTVPASDEAALRQAIKQHCAARLQRYCVPVKINFGIDPLEGHRLKRRRSPQSGELASAPRKET
jgi:long-chain acyl-CoA synthetase